MKVWVLILNLIAAPALADDSGLIGAAGALTRETGTGAAANRRTADQLFQQSLSDEKTALSTFPPNIGLLAKAGSMAMDGIKADQQSQYLAKAAMNSINSGNNAGQFDTKNYGGLSQDQINTLATTNSSLRGEVQSHLEGWGMKVSPDGNNISLPLGMGSISINAGMDALDSGMKGAAKMLGYKTDDITNGLQQAVAARDAIARKAEADAKALAASAGANSTSMASTDGKDDSDAKAVVSPESAQAAGEAVTMVAMTDADSKQVEIMEQQAALDNYRDQLKAKMGISDQPMLGRSDQDIFNMIHLRYQKLRKEASFIEDGSQVVAFGH